MASSGRRGSGRQDISNPGIQDVNFQRRHDGKDSAYRGLWESMMNAPLLLSGWSPTFLLSFFFIALVLDDNAAGDVWNLLPQANGVV